MKYEFDYFFCGLLLGILAIAIMACVGETLDTKNKKKVVVYRKEDVENSIIYYEDECTNTQYTLNNGILEVRGLKGE